MSLFGKSRFKYMQFTIRFQKISHYVNDFEWKEISDDEIMDVLKKLKTKYYFDILQVDLRESTYTSFIKIKCRKCDKAEIFADFCSELKEYIRRMSF